ncbi:MAG TPA: hypothetical protein DCG51_08420 [Erysipelotrichaceae bacterium]|jgi:flavodoxin|nr:hypothetical protein [Erysipelotrichaceae bacterium]
MPEVKLIYQSSSGHAYSVAKAVGNELNTKPIDIHEPAVLSDTDLLILCIETRDGKPDHYLLDYLDQLPVNSIKDAALISTSLSGRDYTELAVGLLGHKGISVYPKRLCLKRGIMRFFRSRPNESDLKEARLFAREVAAACGQ